MAARTLTQEIETMPSYCTSSFLVLESRKEQMLARVERWSPDQLTYAPSSDSWSALQVIDHLIRSEKSIRQSAERGLAGDRRNMTYGERLRAEVFFFAFRFPVRVLIPMLGSAVRPVEPESLARIRDSWAEERHLLQGSRWLGCRVAEQNWKSSRPRRLGQRQTGCGEHGFWSRQISSSGWRYVEEPFSSGRYKRFG